jgi:hypothetical protein
VLSTLIENNLQLVIAIKDILKFNLTILVYNVRLNVLVVLIIRIIVKHVLSTLIDNNLHYVFATKAILKIRLTILV